MLLTRGGSNRARSTSSAPPEQRPQRAGQALAPRPGCPAGRLPAVLGQPQDGRGQEQPEAGERPAEVGTGVGAPLGTVRGGRAVRRGGELGGSAARPRRGAGGGGR